jgi:dTDP-4-amino-4,6-dideoxygalactose transaminase
MSGPDLTEAEFAAVEQVLRTPTLSIGPQIDCFEREFERRLGVPHAIGVSSGTSGLHLCLLAAGVQDGDLVITSPFSFVASANVILYERAIPIFVDVDPATGNLDTTLLTECVADLLRGGSQALRWLPPALRPPERQPRPTRLRALLPVHTYGQPADMDPILAVAREHGLAVVEDACEAVGAAYKGRQAGTLGDAGVFAFYPNKQMTTGEGGMIVTGSSDWDVLFRSLRNQGRDVFDGWLNHTRLGYNYRLDELSAALGLAQLRRLDELLEKRARVAGWYTARLAGHPAVHVPRLAETTTRMSWFVYVVRILPPANRDMIVRSLAAEGIPSRPYFTPIHQQPFYVERFGYATGSFPVTENLGQISLALPFSSIMTEAQVDTVCCHLVSALEAVA